MLLKCTDWLLTNHLDNQTFFISWEKFENHWSEDFLLIGIFIEGEEQAL